MVASEQLRVALSYHGREVFSLSPHDERIVAALRQSHRTYETLDRWSRLVASMAARADGSSFT